jgi:hypothetical protein
MNMRPFLLFALLLGCMLPGTFAQQAQPPFSGTINVRTINTIELLNTMNAGTINSSSPAGGFIPVAAHRGFWRDVPENSLQAIEAAYNGGDEAVEIDVRIASNLNTSPPPTIPPTQGTPIFKPFATAGSYGVLQDQKAQLVLSHDECVDRVSMGTGALRYAAKTNCTNGKGYTGAQYKAIQLRDRHGNPATINGAPITVPTFKEALSTLESYLSIDSNGILRGPVMVVDLKDKDQSTGEFIAWNEYVHALTELRNTLPSEYWPAVIFKLKMAAHLPSSQILVNEIASHPGYGHVVLTINPEDAGNDATVEAAENEDSADGSTVQAGYGWNGQFFLQLQSETTAVPFLVQQFEFVANNPSDDTNHYLSSAISSYATNPTNPSPLYSWATYYQPSFYPEGVAFRFGTCCQLAGLVPTDPGAQAAAIANKTPPIENTDERGILDFATYYDASAQRTNTITSDNLFETFNYLVAIGARNTSLIQ